MGIPSVESNRGQKLKPKKILGLIQFIQNTGNAKNCYTGKNISKAGGGDRWNTNGYELHSVDREEPSFFLFKLGHDENMMVLQ